MKMFLLFSHQLTDEQKKDAIENLKVTKFISLPEKLQKLWSNIPPEIDSLGEYLNDIKSFIRLNANKGDFILIQGDFGAVCEMVKFSKENNFVGIYATTKREVVEEKDGDKVVKKSIFKHIRFRRYYA
jgi:phosphomannomutase